MRKVIIDDRNLLKILNDKEKLQKEINEKIDKFKNLTKIADELQAQIKDLQEKFKVEHEKIKDDVEKIDADMRPYMVKLERFKDKIYPIVDSKGIELGEFETISNIKLENGKVVAEIEDLLENYAEKLRANKA